MATVLFLHGWNSKPGGVKPTYLAEHGHTVINPALPDEDFAESVRIAQAELDRHHPDVVVGSSRGGAVAMNVDARGAALVLLCPAWKKWGTATTVKPGTVILHSEADDVVPIATAASCWPGVVCPKRPSSSWAMTTAWPSPSPWPHAGGRREARAERPTDRPRPLFPVCTRRFPWSDRPFAGRRYTKHGRCGHSSDFVWCSGNAVCSMTAPAGGLGAWVPMTRWTRWIFLVAFGWAVLVHGRAEAAAEVKLGKDFLDGVVAKLPPTSFEKADKYRGTVHSYRLVAIDPRTRQFLVACQIEGEFHPPVTGPDLRASRPEPANARRWRKFRFDVKARSTSSRGSMGSLGFGSRSMRSRSGSSTASPELWPSSWVNTSMSWSRRSPADGRRA